MTFLSKLGGILAKGIGIATGFLPLISQAFPGASGTMAVISKDLAEIAVVVANIEMIGQLKNLPGAEKARAAGPLVAQILMRSTVMSGQKIANPVLFNQGCINIAGGLADVLNSLHEAGIKETPLKP